MKFTSAAIAVSLFVFSHSFAYARLEGKIYDLDLENNQYTIQEHRTGNLHVFDFKDSTTIRIKNGKYNDLAVLDVGESVIYRKKANKKTVQYIDAKIKELDPEAQNITFIDMKNGDLRTIQFSSETKSSSGRLSREFGKLTPGSRVVLEVVER